ncbi:hypothetical protein M0811_08599 [Anaeramoeba ignava]|uniref:PH domain-containing protein n=1 Tax=Anaeramoeba ignava TaxID=1746090 RepID=A0A9Q0RAV0_ANAIG|nr:hypothetical protein M0811_08599 [Anaeramoeba ignava]
MNEKNVYKEASIFMKNKGKWKEQFLSIAGSKIIFLESGGLIEYIIDPLSQFNPIYNKKKSNCFQIVVNFGKRILNLSSNSLLELEEWKNAFFLSLQNDVDRVMKKLIDKTFQTLTLTPDLNSIGCYVLEKTQESQNYKFNPRYLKLSNNELEIFHQKIDDPRKISLLNPQLKVKTIPGTQLAFQLTDSKKINLIFISSSFAERTNWVEQIGLKIEELTKKSQKVEQISQQKKINQIKKFTSNNELNEIQQNEYTQNIIQIIIQIQDKNDMLLLLFKNEFKLMKISEFKKRIGFKLNKKPENFRMFISNHELTKFNDNELLSNFLKRENSENCF